MSQKEEEREKEFFEEERRKREKENKEGSMKAMVKEKQEEKAKITEIKKEEEHLSIPFIEIERVQDSELKKVELEEEFPKIEKVKRIVSIPLIQLQEAPVVLKKHELDTSITKIEKRKKSTALPIVKVVFVPKVSFQHMMFDTQIKKPSQITLTEVKVPIYWKTIYSLPKPLLENFDLSINEQLKERLKRKEEVRKELSTASIGTSSVELPPSSVPGIEDEEIPELFDLIFSVENGGKVDSDNPKVIILEETEEDAHIGILRTLCMRIYREKVGGKPKPVIISDIKKFMQEVERWMEAEDKIFSVKLTDQNLKVIEVEDKDFWNAVKDRIESLFSQRFGFIIFENRLNQKIPLPFFSLHHFIDIIHLIPKKLSYEVKKEIASMSWGFVNLDDLKEEDVPWFDTIFEEARTRFENKLNEIGEPYLSATKRDKDSESDDLHYPIKLFLVKYLAKEMNLKHLDEIREKILTEKEITYREGEYKIAYRPDIYVSSPGDKFNGQAFEVETLFGQGKYPLKKIDETIEKYEKASNVSKVNIVIDNLTFLRHINGLRKKLKLHEELRKKGKRNFDLEFYTLDLQNEKLVPLQEVVKRLKNLQKLL